MGLVPKPPYTPSVGYYDANAGVLKYARFSDDGWQSEPVDAVGETRWAVAMALMPRAPYTPCLAFIGDFNLRFACRVAGGWTTETVDYGGDAWYESIESPSLALATTPPYTPHISYSYHHFQGGDLRYAHRGAGGWITETVANGGQASIPTSLVLDAAEQPHVATVLDAVVHVYGADGAWISETVDSGASASAVSLALDAEGYPHISYRTDAALKYAIRDGSVWRRELVDDLGAVGFGVSLGLENGNQPRLAYYDRSTSDLKFAWIDGSDQVPSTGGSLGAHGAAHLTFPARTSHFGAWAALGRHKVYLPVVLP